MKGKEDRSDVYISGMDHFFELLDDKKPMTQERHTTIMKLGCILDARIRVNTEVQDKE